MVEHPPTSEIPPASPAPTSVYRYYDRDGVLLYVGITSRGPERNREHFKSKEWWRFVFRQDVSHYASRREAEEHERNLIQRYQPPFNVVHNPLWESLREEYLDGAERPSKEEQQAWSAGFTAALDRTGTSYAYSEMLWYVVDHRDPSGPFGGPAWHSQRVIGGANDADSIHPA